MAKAFKPGGTPGKLHRALGIPVGERIPYARLREAMHSKDAEVRDMAIRAHVMAGWSKKGRAKKK